MQRYKKERSTARAVKGALRLREEQLTAGGMVRNAHEFLPEKVAREKVQAGRREHLLYIHSRFTKPKARVTPAWVECIVSAVGSLHCLQVESDFLYLQ